MAYDGQWPYPMYQLLDHFVTYNPPPPPPHLLPVEIKQPTFSFMSVMKPIALFPSKKVTFDTRKYNFDMNTFSIRRSYTLNKETYKNSTVWADLSDHYPIIGRFSFAPAQGVSAQGAPEEEKVSATKEKDVILNRLNTHILSDTSDAEVARLRAALAEALDALAEARAALDEARVAAAAPAPVHDDED